MRDLFMNMEWKDICYDNIAIQLNLLEVKAEYNLGFYQTTIIMLK